MKKLSLVLVLMLAAASARAELRRAEISVFGMD